MKTDYIISVLLTAVCLAACSPQNRTDATAMKLHGQVKSVRTYSYEADEKFGEIIKGEKSGFSYGILFNQSGTMREWNLYDEFLGELVSKEIYADKSEEGKPECCLYNFAGELTGTYVSSYDSKGNRTERCCYNSEGELERKLIFSYDSQENQVIHENVYKSGILFSKSILSYDSDGNMIESCHYNSQGDLKQKSIYSYDKKGNMIECFQYDSNENLELKEFYTYEFDSEGNWIQQITFRGEERLPQIVTERIIEYY